MQNHDAADLVQDVLTILVQKLPAFRYEPNKRFRGWLWTVTLNTFRMDRRRVGKLPEVETVALEQVRGARWCRGHREDRVSTLSSRSAQLMQTEFQPTTWQACWEHVISDRPAAEVAAELGISACAVDAPSRGCSSGYVRS